MRATDLEIIDSATETFEFIEYPDSDLSSPLLLLGTLDPLVDIGGFLLLPKLSNLAAFKVFPVDPLIEPSFTLPDGA